MPTTTLPRETSPTEVVALVEQARTAAATWAGSVPAARAALLDAIASALDASGERLVAIAAEETHLTTARLTGELERTTMQLRLLATTVRDGGYLGASIDPPRADWRPAPRPDLRKVNRPVGPVVVFAAGNFPLAFSVAGGDTASALAAGCPVLLKAHPGHLALSRATAEVVLAALREVGAPDGTFALLVGDEAGRRALTHPDVKAGAFTGSARGGRALHDLAQSRPEPIPFHAEMGSVNPVVVTPEAALARGQEVVDGFVASFSLSQGQLCTKPGVLLLPAEGITDEQLRHAVAGRIGAPLLNDVTRDRYLDTLGVLSAHDHVQVIALGPDATGHEPAPALLGTDALSVLDDPTLLDEAFGPASLVVRYADEDDLHALLDVLPGQLTATVQCLGDEPGLHRLLETLADRAGRVVVNGWPTGVAVTHAMHHGGPYPASTAAMHTSVGTDAIVRFTRPVCYQDVPDHLLPAELQDANPLGIPRRVDGQLR